MKRKGISFFLITASLILILATGNGCKKDAPIGSSLLGNDTLTYNDSCLASSTNCNCVRYIGIQMVEGPNSGSVNTNIPFAVNWEFVTTCNTFDTFEQTQVQNTVTIKAYSSNNLCTGCGQIVRPAVDTFYFKPASAGTYILKFYNPYQTSNGGFIDETVTVN